MYIMMYNNHKKIGKCKFIGLGARSLKRIGILLAFSVFSIQLSAQPQLSQTTGTAQEWHEFEETEDFSVTDPESFFTSNATFFKLGESRFKLLREDTDKYGFTHYKFVQEDLSGVKIEGTRYVLHRKSDGTLKGNGHYVKDFGSHVGYSLSLESALSTAKSNHPLEKYFKAQAPEMVYYSPEYSKQDMDYELCWKVEIHGIQDGEVYRSYVYISMNNEELGTESRIHHTDTPGTAVTAYDGEQAINTYEDVPGTYILMVEDIGGASVHTYNLNGGDDYGAATNWSHNDTFWEVELDTGTQAHYGVSTSARYFNETYGWSGIDNQRGDVLVYTNGTTRNNAFWNGEALTFGNGDGVNGIYSPLDVCAHELAHAVTMHSSGLIYRLESGALNESFSDIFGSAVEYYERGGVVNWRCSSDNRADGLGIRNMQNPNEFNDPDTYLGDFWYYGAGDNGGVHTNSGVQNFWFYLLSEGGSDTNDNLDEYNVTGIGVGAAARIAYRNLTSYLGPNSNYFDAREGSLQAAEDIYGRASQEYASVAAAWHAVGVGSEVVASNDLGISNVEVVGQDCNQLNVTIKNFSITDAIDAGEMTTISIYVNDQLSIETNFVFLADLEPGGEVVMEQIVPLVNQYNHLLAEIFYETDPVVDNNSFELHAFSGSISIGQGQFFSTPAAALQALKQQNAAICGNIVFNILPGIYNEQLYISDIATDENHQLTIQSAEGEGTVFINYNTFRNIYGPVVLHDMEYVSIQGLNILNRGVSGNSIHLRGSVANVSIEKNHLDSFVGIQTLFFSPASNIEIRDNTFEYSDEGQGEIPGSWFLSSEQSDVIDGLTITGNRSYGTGGSSFTGLLVNNVVFSDNIFFHSGLRIVNGENMIITNNVIMRRLTVVNVQNALISNNTFLERSAFSNSDNIELVNNVFAELQYVDNTSFVRRDHNIYQLNGDLIRLDNQFYNLEELQQATGFDMNSFIYQPEYNEDLSLSENPANYIMQNGLPLQEVPLDIFGNVRNEYSPTIGAEELLTYCTNDGDTRYEFIRRVEIGEIDNTSGDNGGYADFTHLTTEFGIGRDAEIILHPGFNGASYREYWAVFIDLNSNRTFEPDERLFTGRSEANGTLSGTIHIPELLTPRSIRLRVVMDYDPITESCGEVNRSWGETEDYTVQLVEDFSYCTSYGNQVYNPWISRVQVGTIDRSSYDDGYSDYTSTSTDIQIDGSSTIPITITTAHDYAKQVEIYGWIDWNRDGDFDDFAETAFGIGTHTSGNMVLSSITVNQNAIAGPTRMRIAVGSAAMNYDDYCTQGNPLYEVEDYTINLMSGSANARSISTIEEKSDNEGEELETELVNPLEIYPNPVSQEVMVLTGDQKLKGKTAVVLSLDGKELMRHNLDGERNSLNVSRLAPGIYLIKIDSYATLLRFIKQ